MRSKRSKSDPAALDNGQRLPRKLLGTFTARMLLWRLAGRSEVHAFGGLHIVFRVDGHGRRILSFAVDHLGHFPPWAQFVERLARFARDYIRSPRNSETRACMKYAGSAWPKRRLLTGPQVLELVGVEDGPHRDDDALCDLEPRNPAHLSIGVVEDDTRLIVNTRAPVS